MITVLGGGMGVAAAYALGVLGHKVELIDHNPAIIENAQKLLDVVNEEKYEKINCIVGDYTNMSSDTKTVLSCLPYHQNYQVAHHCIGKGINYTDLGGSVEVGKQIEEYANRERNKGKCVVMHSLGLAPGLVNLIASSLTKHEVPDSITMYVGGLPIMREYYQEKDYAINWSIDGLLNQYLSKCEILEDGEIKMEEPLSDYEVLEDGYLEAFTTSGGIAQTLKEMQSLGVKNCKYKTIRYMGHFEKLKTLMACLDKEELKVALIKLYPYIKEDVVFIEVNTIKENNGRVINTNYSQIIHHDPMFSAMARATGYSAASIVDLIASGFVTQNIPTYADIPSKLFFNNLEKLGL